MLPSRPVVCAVSSLAAVTLLLGACQQRVQVRPDTGRLAAAARRAGPKAQETVGLWLSPEFLGRVERIEQGPFTTDFELGRGGASLVEQAVQARFARVVRMGSAPPLALGVNPEVDVIFVPSWTEFSFDQQIMDGPGAATPSGPPAKAGLSPEDASAAGPGADGQGPDFLVQLSSGVGVTVLALRRDGSQLSSHAASGRKQVEIPAAAGANAMARATNGALEELGERLLAELGSPALAASVVQARELRTAQDAVAQRATARRTARPLYVHPFVGRGPAAGEVTGLQSAVVARLLGSAHFVAVASGDRAAQVDAVVRDTNRDATEEEEWIRIGAGRGAQLMLTGELSSAAAACSVKIELTDLASRLVLGAFFRPLPACTAANLAALAQPAAAAMIDAVGAAPAP